MKRRALMALTISTSSDDWKIDKTFPKATHRRDTWIPLKESLFYAPFLNQSNPGPTPLHGHGAGAVLGALSCCYGGQFPASTRHSCWVAVCDAGPTLTHLWVNVSCCYGRQGPLNAKQDVKCLIVPNTTRETGKKIFSQCWANVCNTSPPLKKDGLLTTPYLRVVATFWSYSTVPTHQTYDGR